MVDIVIAEDHPGLRRILCALLNSERDLRVVGEAGDGRAALQLVEELHPDILLADIIMPEPDGIEVTRSVSDSSPTTNVLILSLHDDGFWVGEAMAAGAKGYVPKQRADAELVPAIRSISLGQTYYPQVL